MKFSVIIPVYNVEKYLEKCIDSVLNQTYENFEIIIVNDGSPDNSQVIIDKYKKKYPLKIKSYIKENGGLSDARNYGVQFVTGDYILFLDSDDFISNTLIENIHKTIVSDNSPDLIKYNYTNIYENKEGTETFDTPELHSVSGEEMYLLYAKERILFEMAWLYAYRTDFYKEKQLEFSVGKIHEDFELTPRAIILAEKVSSINFPGYYYLQREGTITKDKNYQKRVKSAYDVLSHFDTLNKFAINIKNKETKQYFLSYISNAVLDAATKLNDEDLLKYIEEIKSRKIPNKLMNDTLQRKFKKMYVKINLINYIKRNR